MPTIKLNSDRMRFISEEMAEIEKIKDRLDRIENALNLVLCKDCEYNPSTDEWIHCDRVTWWNSPDDYCSRGERKGVEDDS